MGKSISSGRRVGTAGLNGFTRGGSAFAFQSGLSARVLHTWTMVRPPFRDLPMGLQEPYCVDGIQPGVEHPVVSRAKPRQVVRGVIAGVLIQVSYLEASSKLEATHSAAMELVGRIQHPSSFSLVAEPDGWRRRRKWIFSNRVCHSSVPRQLVRSR